MLNGFVDYHMDVSGMTGGMVGNAGVNMTFNIQSGLPVQLVQGLVVQI
ncbi:MAG: hypothetical protein CM1200mP10_07790 [Candidatus Neomarinimicrobiota bacterium]|nr:MAG: hypothetical protein CM1200mP10_07790 [Candidatus Neomarinimicrobiota bacterium]